MGIAKLRGANRRWHHEKVMTRYPRPYKLARITSRDIAE